MILLYAYSSKKPVVVPFPRPVAIFLIFPYVFISLIEVLPLKVSVYLTLFNVQNTLLTDPTSVIDEWKVNYKKYL